MSRLFYHVMQDNVGNLLFDVSGTMRLAGTGTLATIYGDEALTVVLPNPMTNHPSFGSFKCFLGAGDYDFYMAKAGYTFETLTGVQGHGTLAQQDANAVAITGGTIGGVSQVGIHLTPVAALDIQSQQAVAVQVRQFSIGGIAQAYTGLVAAATGCWNLYMAGTAQNYLAGSLGIGVPGGVPSYPLHVVGQGYLTGSLGVHTAPLADRGVNVVYARATENGLVLQPTADTGPGNAALFLNLAGATVGTIVTNASATAYNTSSDVRLKDAIATLTGALDTIRALRPVQFVWQATGEPGVGFLAHEVQQVVPEVVTGEPEAVDTAGRLLPQQMDHSKLVPWLVGAVQALVAQVEALAARLDAAGA